MRICHRSFVPYRTEGPPPPPPPAPPVCVSYLFRRWLHRPRPRFALPPPPLPSSLPACLARAPRRVVGRPSVADPAPGGPVQVRLLPPFFALIGRTRCVGTRFQANLWSSSSGLGGRFVWRSICLPILLLSVCRSLWQFLHISFGKIRSNLEQMITLKSEAPSHYRAT